MIVTYVDKDELLDDFTLTIEFTDKPIRGNEISVTDCAKLILSGSNWESKDNKIISYMDRNLIETYKDIEKRSINII